jgi:hypothetical protein
MQPVCERKRRASRRHQEAVRDVIPVRVLELARGSLRESLRRRPPAMKACP